MSGKISKRQDNQVCRWHWDECSKFFLPDFEFILVQSQTYTWAPHMNIPVS